MKILLVLLLSCAPSLARVGETYAELIKHYGKPTKSNPKESRHYFSHQDYEIGTLIRDGVCVMELYSVPDRALSASEVARLMGDNGNGLNWDHYPANEKSSEQWVRKDKALIALHSLHGGAFMIWSYKEAKLHGNADVSKAEFVD